MSGGIAKNWPEQVEKDGRSRSILLGQSFILCVSYDLAYDMFLSLTRQSGMLCRETSTGSDNGG